MAQKNKYDYFDTFVRLVGYACDAAALLDDTFRSFDAVYLSARLEQMHQIEHSADEVRHEMIAKLTKEFITPIEREDILTLANAADDVVDTIEDVLMRIYMYNITTLESEALAFSQIIIACCEALKSAMTEFTHFRKSDKLHGLIVEVNRLEEKGDALYTRAMHSLFSSQKDALHVYGWSQVYDQLEMCSDACEEVSNVMENVIMKNT